MCYFDQIIKKNRLVELICSWLGQHWSCCMFFVMGKQWGQLQQKCFFCLKLLPVLHVGIFEFAIMMSIRSRYHGVTTGRCSWKKQTFKQNDSENVNVSLDHLILDHMFIRRLSLIFWFPELFLLQWIFFQVSIKITHEQSRFLVLWF